MISELIQLILLFAVIFDPLASFAVFFTASAHMTRQQRKKTATLAVLVALGLSIAVLVFGNLLLTLFSTTMDEFRIAGGIILGILGVKMTLGYPLTHLNEAKNNSGKAIAAIIATPLLTGPATITAIIVSVADYGRMLTGIAIVVVLFLTAIIFYQAEWINRKVGQTAIQVMSTILGLVTLAWGVKFVATGVKAMIVG